MATNASFGIKLREMLNTYLPEWVEWRDGDFDISKKPVGVSVRSLQRWIEGKTIPNPRAFRSFLNSIPEQRNFPKNDLESLYYRVRRGVIDTETGCQEASGSKAYNDLFNIWCENAVSQICILQNWMSYPERFVDGLVRAVSERNIPLRVLLLSPNSEYVDKRYEERHRRSFAFWGDLYELQENILEKGLNHHENFTLRFYDTTPPFAAYIADSNILLAQFWYGHTTASGPHLIINKNSSYGSYIMATFDRVWEISQPPEGGIDNFFNHYHDQYQNHMRSQAKD